jgi:hypothetical protein
LLKSKLSVASVNFAGVSLGRSGYLGVCAASIPASRHTPHNPYVTLFISGQYNNRLAHYFPPVSWARPSFFVVYPLSASGAQFHEIVGRDNFYAQPAGSAWMELSSMLQVKQSLAKSASGIGAEPS